MNQFRETIDEVLYDQRSSRSPRANQGNRQAIARENNKSALSVAPPA